MVIVLILLTVAALGFLLYRYLCHNKGDYRTTGELAPGEDPDEEYSNKATSEKKEYFIWTLWRLGKKNGFRGSLRGCWTVFFSYICVLREVRYSLHTRPEGKKTFFVMKILLWKTQWSTSNAKDKICYSRSEYWWMRSRWQDNRCVGISGARCENRWWDF